VALQNSGNETQSGNITVDLQTETEGAWSPCIGENGNVGIANVNFRVAMRASDESGLASFGQRAVSNSVRGGVPVVTERQKWLWRKCEEPAKPSASQTTTQLESSSTSPPTESPTSVKPTES
jgi:hypothetical protein